jgi:signal transduction histidine kinase
MRYWFLPLLFLGLCFILISCNFNQSNSEIPPNAVRGELDLTQWDFKKNGPVKIAGEWAFYDDQILLPKDFNDQSIPFSRHLDIRHFVTEDSNEGARKGTFRLKLYLPKNLLAVEFVDILSKDNALFIDDIKCTPDWDPKFKKYVASMSKNLYIVPQHDIVYLTIHVSDLNRNVIIGDYQSMLYDSFQSGSIQLVLFGAISMIGLYYFILFLYRKKDRSNLYFSLFCFSITIYQSMLDFQYNLSTIGISQFILKILTLPFGMILYSYIGLFSTVLISLSLSAFIYEMFQVPFTKKCKILFQLVNGSLILEAIACLTLIDLIFLNEFVLQIQALNPLLIQLLNLFNHLQNFSILLIVVLIFYIVIKSLYLKTPGSVGMLFGLSFLAFATLQDILSVYFVDLENKRLIAIATFILILFQSIILAKKLSNTFHKVELLSNKLEQSRQRMLIDISHDLKTPITTISGYAKAIAEGVVEDEEKKNRYLQTIYRKSMRVSSMINDLFEFSKMDVYDPVYHYEKVELVEFLRSILVEHYQQIEEKGLVLDFVEIDQVIYLKIDKKAMARVISNLITNAIQYNPSGTTIRVELIPTLKNVTIEVGDNGNGIPDELADKIFEPFVRGDMNRSRDDGTGLGLAISKRIVEIHGGHIFLQRNVKYEKTIFQVVLEK